MPSSDGVHPPLIPAHAGQNHSSEGHSKTIQLSAAQMSALKSSRDTMKTLHIVNNPEVLSQNLSMTFTIHYERKNADVGVGFTVVPCKSSASLLIETVDKDGPCKDRLQPKDHIIAIDNNLVTTLESLQKELDEVKKNRCFAIEVRRDNIWNELDALRQRKLIVEARSPDYRYVIVQIEHKSGGPQLGLLIKHRTYKVLVSRVEINSLSSLVLVRGDHIMDVNGQPVTDKEVAKKAILNTMTSKKPITLLVERGACEEARNELLDLLYGAEKMKLGKKDKEPPCMAEDVRAITLKELERRKKEKHDQLHSILRDPNVKNNNMSDYMLVTANSARIDSCSLSSNNSNQSFMKNLFGRVRTNNSNSSKIRIAPRATEVSIGSSALANTRLKRVNKRF